MEKLNKQKTTFYYYLLYFLIYALIGWLMETTYAYFTLGHFVKRGFLYGPICPIYGWGAIILISTLKKYKSKPLYLFIYSAIIFSIFEYVASFSLEALFCDRWWDYSNDFLNLNGRISIFYSFAWGIIALVFLYIVHPLIEKIVNKLFNKIEKNIQFIILNSGFVIVVIDTILSSIRYLNIL